MELKTYSDAFKLTDEKETDYEYIMKYLYFRRNDLKTIIDQMLRILALDGDSYCA